MSTVITPTPIKAPSVSIGMPVFNGERFIRRALDSLLNQEYKDFEIIISDNGSTDNTSEICLEYATTDDRIRFFSHASNRGSTWNFREVLNLATGDYFMFAGCHDLWDPKFLFRCVPILDLEQGVVLAYSLAVEIDLADSPIRRIVGTVDSRSLSPNRRFRKVLSNINGYPTYGLFRRAILSDVLPNIPATISQDMLLLAEMSFLGEFAVIEEELFFLRRNSISVHWKRYFQNLQLSHSFFDLLMSYFNLLKNYQLLISRRTTRPRARIGLLLFVWIVVFRRTFLWVLALGPALISDRYYRPW